MSSLPGLREAVQRLGGRTAYAAAAFSCGLIRTEGSGKKAVELKKLRQIIKELFTRYFAEKDRTAKPKLIDGNIVMKN